MWLFLGQHHSSTIFQDFLKSLGQHKRCVEWIEPFLLQQNWEWTQHMSSMHKSTLYSFLLLMPSIAKAVINLFQCGIVIFLFLFLLVILWFTSSFWYFWLCSLWCHTCNVQNASVLISWETFCSFNGNYFLSCLLASLP